MNPETRDHATDIKNWILRNCTGLPLEQQVLFLERTLRRLLKRIEPTLGAVVLTSLGERVLHDSAQRFPFLSTLKIDPSTNVIDFSAFKKDMGPIQQEEFTMAFASIFSSLFILIDRLTGEILTPVMYSQLLDKPTTESL